MVPSVDVRLEFPAGGGGTSALTSAGGAYAFSSIREQAWTIEPSLIGELDSSITEMDAAAVLSVAAGDLTLAVQQRLAADVSGNGEVTSHDASLILQRVTELTTTFPVAETCASDWVFFPAPSENPMFGNQTITNPQTSFERCIPGSVTLDPLVGQVEGLDFLAIAFGDVDGSWASLRAGQGAVDETIALGRPQLRGASAQIPIDVAAVSPYQSLYLVVLYDADTLVFSGMHPHAETRAALTVVNDETPGKLIIAAANATGLESTQPFTLEFRTTSPTRYPVVSLVEAELGPR